MGLPRPISFNTMNERKQLRSNGILLTIMTLASLETPIVYPEPDGSPMAESDRAREYLIYCVEALKFYFLNLLDVYVSGNLWLSYQQGVPDAVVSPDVFVVFGVENRPRRSYKVWLENGKTPDWVLEVTSKSTRDKDEQEKPITYAQMGVSEYFQYDPTGDYLTPALKGRRLVKGRYQLLTPNCLEDGTLVFFSIVLGLEIRLLPDGKLRFFDPSTEEYLRSPEESERERIQERLEKEQERQEKERERQEKERERQEKERERQEKERERQEKERERERADRLAARLRELGIDPDEEI